METLERLTSCALPRRVAIGVAVLVVALAAGCAPAISPREAALRATVEALRSEVSQLQAEGAASTVEPLAPTSDSTVDADVDGLLFSSPTEPSSTPDTETHSLASSDWRLLDWRPVAQMAEVGDLTLSVNAILRGQESYGGPFGASIAATQGTRIMLADLSLGKAFHAGATPVEVHVDFLVVGDSQGVEYRGLPAPMTNALPERFFLSPGQGFRGIVAFILPDDLESDKLYFTNFLGGHTPPERLTVDLQEIP